MATLDSLITTQGLLFTALFAVAIYVLTLLVRRLFEAIWPTLSTSTPLSAAQRLWEEVVLPFLPVVFGAVGARFLAQYPFPTLVMVSSTAKLMYGIAVGWFSAYIYDAVRFFVKKKWNVGPADGQKNGG